MNTATHRGKFHMACRNQDIDTMKTMIENGFDPSFDNNTMLKQCIMSQYATSINILLEECSKFGKFDEEVFKMSLLTNNINYVKLLLDHPNTTIPKNLEKLWEDVEQILRLFYPHHEIETLLDDEIKQLVTEHVFRLDGPVYNDNIL